MSLQPISPATHVMVKFDGAKPSEEKWWDVSFLKKCSNFCFKANPTKKMRLHFFQAPLFYFGLLHVLLHMKLSSRQNPQIQPCGTRCAAPNKVMTIGPNSEQTCTGWWFQRFFMFTPIWGRLSDLTHIFQMGLKPPTRKL